MSREATVELQAMMSGGLRRGAGRRPHLYAVLATEAMR
jgi:hypothetical protein